MPITPLLFLVLILPFSIQADTQSWAEKTLSSMTLEEKIGQLFMVTVLCEQDRNTTLVNYWKYPTNTKYIESLIQDYHIGGVIFLGQGTHQAQFEATQQFQQLSTIPLLVGHDCEWGFGPRLDGCIQLPLTITLGAVQDNQLIYAIGRAIALQCHAMGVHMNFAPVVDVNTNPQNPIINSRSFGHDPLAVATKASAYMHGLQDGGILACAKHFPGHGDTSVDSHYNLPVIEHDKERLNTVELVPFKQLIDEGVDAIMTAHLSVLAYKNDRMLPASLSQAIVTTLLQDELGFKNLIITDALNMKGVTDYAAPGEAEYAAFCAGNDILLCPLDVQKAITLIKQGLIDGTIDQEDIDRRVHKILQAKEKTACVIQPYLDENERQVVLNSPDTQKLKQQLFDAAITIARDTKATLPLSSKMPWTLLQLGFDVPCITDEDTLFKKATRLTLQDNAAFDPSNLSAHIDPAIPLVITIQGTHRYASTNYNITQETIALVNDLCRRVPNTIVMVFGNPYSLGFFTTASTLICGYEDDPCAHKAAFKVLFGHLPARGKLPV